MRVGARAIRRDGAHGGRAGRATLTDKGFLKAPTGDMRMPLYGYHCADCNKDSELLMRSSDVPVCPACGSQKMERLMSRVVAEGPLKAVAKSWRAQAAREGHTSNFSRSERGGS